MLCQEKAEKLGIRTARLPIGTYLEKLPTRKVLTVNQVSCLSPESIRGIERTIAAECWQYLVPEQVFAILVQYIAFQSWSAAFEAVIPQRKYQPGKKTKRKKVGATISEGAEPLTDEEDEDAAEADSIGEDEISEEAVMNTWPFLISTAISSGLRSSQQSLRRICSWGEADDLQDVSVLLKMRVQSWNTDIANEKSATSGIFRK